MRRLNDLATRAQTNSVDGCPVCGTESVPGESPAHWKEAVQEVKLKGEGQRRTMLRDGLIDQKWGGLPLVKPPLNLKRPF